MDKMQLLAMVQAYTGIGIGLIIGLGALQLEDALFLLKRFLLSLRYMAWSLEQLENLVDWWRDKEPVLKVAVPHVIDVLEDLEHKSIFKGYQAMLTGCAKIAQTYSPGGH